jgi:MYXO-CTERM domain-containing protein
MRCDLSARQLALGLAAVTLSAAPPRGCQYRRLVGDRGATGGAAQVCVSLVTGGEEVAGTQNDLVWDGTCMSLNENGCSAAGTHGKQVNTRLQNSADFRMRVLVLSLSDVDPIDDGVLYCCRVQGEAPSGSCCSISVVNTGASDSKGKAVAGVGGNTGPSAPRAAAGGGGGAVGAATGGQMANNMANNPGAVGQGMPAGNTGGGNVGSGAQRVTRPRRRPTRVGGAAVRRSRPRRVVGVQVLPGGGGGQVAQAPQVQAPATPSATRAAGALVQPAAPAVPAAALPPATAVAAAPTAPPTPADTPTKAVPTAVPPTKAPPSTPTAPRSTPTAASGWFGCQIGGGASAAPMLGLGLLFAALAGVRRRRPPHR